MKIYVSHSSGFDFKTELYTPLKESFSEHDIFLPHEHGDEVIDTKEVIRSSDLVLAEVSYPSTGQGIELGWANDANMPIICIHKAGSNPSSALRIITNKFAGYISSDDLIITLREFL